MQPGADFILVSCAAGSRENANEIASALVSERLAACVHVLPIESHYRWKGDVCREPEFLLQAKTTADRLAAIEALIKRLHTYELPEIAAVPIQGGSAEYLAWIAESVSPANERIVGWLLDQEDRDQLLALFLPAYANLVAHHVTLGLGTKAALPLPRETEGIVVGSTDDGAGVQALVVEIGGTARRPDGSTYHITWSLAEGREAVESNDVLRTRGWTASPQRHRIRLEPAVLAARPTP